MGVNGQPILFEKRRQFHRVGGCSCWCHCLSIKSCSLLPVRTVRPRAFRPPSSEEFPRGLRLLPFASDIRAKVRHPPRKVSLRRRERVAGFRACEQLPPTSRASVQNQAFWVVLVFSVLVDSRDSLCCDNPLPPPRVLQRQASAGQLRLIFGTWDSSKSTGRPVPRAEWVVRSVCKVLLRVDMRAGFFPSPETTTAGPQNRARDSNSILKHA